MLLVSTVTTMLILKVEALIHPKRPSNWAYVIHSASIKSNGLYYYKIILYFRWQQYK
jgi:hypothetical protein